MGKFLKYLAIIVVIIFAAVFLAWNMLPSWVAGTLSKKAGVTVTIGEIRGNFSSFEVDNFVMGNPPQSVLSKALTVQKTVATVPVTHLLEQNIVIPQMNLSDLTVGLEFETKGSKNGNWTTIMSNIKQNSPATEDSKRTVLIKRLVLDNLNIELAYRDQPNNITKLKPISHLEFTNVSSTGGIPSAQIMNLVIQQALQQIFSIENLQNMVEDVINNQGDFTKTLKGLFGDNAS